MNDTLHIQIHNGNNIDQWKQTALNVLKAHALKEELEWTNLQVVIRVPDPSVFLTKDPGHSILMVRQTR